MAALFDRFHKRKPTSSITSELVEQVVSRVDPRLKMLSGYQQQLIGPVEAMEQHIAQLLAALPSAATVRIKNYSCDPQLALFFSSPERLKEIIVTSSAMRDWVTAQAQPTDCHCLLLLHTEQRTRLGNAMRNGILRRDVKLPYIDCSGYRLLGLSSDLGLLLDKLQQRAVDEFCNQALARLSQTQSDRLSLQREQDLLKSRLHLRQTGHKGLEAELTHPDQHADLDEQGMTERLRIISEELSRLQTGSPSLEQQLRRLAEFLQHPAQVFSWDWVHQYVDSSGMVHPEGSSEGHAVDWLQFTLHSKAQFAVYPIILPAEELRGLRL